MASQPRRAPLRVDADGVRILKTPGVRRIGWIVAAVVGVVALTVAVAVLLIRREPPRHVADDVAAPSAPGGAASAASAARPAPRRIEPRRIARSATPPPAAADAPAAGAPPPPPPSEPELRIQDVPFAPGDHTGIAVFPPPGTKPVKRGIVVPDDFALPEGFVRHYQTTDDGKRLDAILMFHPDYEFVDEHGARVPVPEDRVVPPEMAPPGLPLRMLDVPDGEGAAGRTP